MPRIFVSGMVLFLAFANVAHAQNTSQVFGRVTDTSGGCCPA